MLKKTMAMCLMAVYLITVNFAQAILYPSADAENPRASVAEDNDYELYVDGEKIEDAGIYIAEGVDHLLIPFRTVLEGMGCTVTWEECTTEELYGETEEGHIYPEIQGIAYFGYGGKRLATVLLKSENQIKYENRYIIVTEEHKRASLDINDHLRLWTMSSEGAALIINDRIYLRENTMELLVQGLECSMEIDKENKRITISKSGKELHKLFIKNSWKSY